MQADVQGEREPCQLKNFIEFVPYVFQVMALLLELNPSSTLPVVYQHNLQPLLSPAFWERTGNVPALVRLLQVHKFLPLFLVLKQGIFA